MSTSSALPHPSTPAPSFLWQQEPQILRRRLLWLMGVRLICSTLLMGGTVIFQLRNLEENANPTQNFVFWLVGATYFLTLLYSFLFPRVNNYRHFAALQLSGDVLVISLLVLATGSQDSLFLFCYLLVIIGAGFLLYRQGAFIFAAASLVMLAIVLFGTMFEGVRMLPFVRTSFPLKPAELLYILVVHTPAFFLIAFLSSHLVEQLRHTGEILHQQQIDFDNLEALHKDITESLTSGLIATNFEGRIQFFNACACDLMGISGDALLGTSLMDLIPPLREVWKRSPDEMFLSKREEVPFVRPDGSRRILGCGFSPLHNRENKRTGVLLLFQDLTPIKQIEDIAREREKLASLGEMAAGLAHEIRNPLSSLSGAIQLLRSELGIESKLENNDHLTLMNIVEREAERLNRLLCDFLLFARPKTILKQQHNLPTLLKESLYLFQQNPHFQDVSIEVKVPEDCSIEVDSQLFHQVLWNLLINAGQAIVENRGKGTIEIEAVEGKKGTSLTITDNGGGISPQAREKIFAPFFSTKREGTGLGLAVVRRIISEHGGHIELEDLKEGHTRFFMLFPSIQLFFEELPGESRPPKSRDELLALTISEQREERIRAAESGETSSVPA